MSTTSLFHIKLNCACCWKGGEAFFGVLTPKNDFLEYTLCEAIFLLCESTSSSVIKCLSQWTRRISTPEQENVYTFTKGSFSFLQIVPKDVYTRHSVGNKVWDSWNPAQQPGLTLHAICFILIICSLTAVHEGGFLSFPQVRVTLQTSRGGAEDAWVHGLLPLTFKLPLMQLFMILFLLMSVDLINSVQV